MSKSDPLKVLLKIKKEKGFKVDDALIKGCYEFQKEHQYDKERVTVKKMETLVEESLKAVDK